MASGTRVVVLGGGYAGVEAVKVLERAFRRDAGVEITLIDRNPYQTMMTELHEVAGGRVPPESVQISFKKIFGATGVRLVTDRIRAIDFEGRELASDAAKYPYDYLVLGTGGEPEFYGIEGIRETALTLWSLDDALKIRRHVEDVFLKAAAEPDARRRSELLTFVVAGAGFTGVELAGELADWRQILCARHHVDEADVRILVVEALDAVVPTLPKHLQRRAQRRLERAGVEFMLKSPIVGAGPDGVRLKGGGCIPTATFVWTCGIQGCEFAANLRLTKGKCSNRMCQFATSKGTCGVKNCVFGGDRYVEGKRGRLLVNELMRSPDYANVYVVGDVGWYLEGKRVLPQIVETAVQTGAAAAHNVIADIRGHAPKPFRSNYRGLMVSLGAYTGVAHVMGISLTGIFAMGVKHAINVLHQFGVAGVNQVWEYLRNEFLDVRNGRSFVGGHLSAVTRGYWVAILRVFLGVMWVIEGIGKVTGGWLDPKKIFIVPAAAVDGTAAASTAAAAAPAAEAAADATAAASAVATASDAGTAAASTAAATPVALLAHPLGIYTWVLDNIIARAPFLFQVLIVLAELGIGLALVGGLFTFLAAAASIALCLVFIAGSMAGKEILWYIAAAIVMLGGAGKAFGLDHWVMPWLQKLWNRTRFARRTYLYVDEPGRPLRGGKAARRGR